MKTALKVWLIIAVSLVVVGGALFCIVMAANGWDFSRLGSRKMVTNTYKITEDFDSVSIRTDIEDISFLPSSDGSCSVVCEEEEKAPHTVGVQDGTLMIGVEDRRAWYDYIGNFTVNFKKPSITVYLPETGYESLAIEEDTGDITIPKDFSFENVEITTSTGNVNTSASSSGLLRIKTSTGNITVSDLSAGTLELSVSTGHVTARNVVCGGDADLTVSTGKAEFTDLSCGSLRSTGSTGDFSLKNVTAEGGMNIKRSTGDVSFDRCDASELEIKTDTGKVTGSLLSPKVFITRSDTGKIDVPETTEGGKCKITTDTGRIQIEIDGE